MPPKTKESAKDSRFASIQTDPRFQLPKKKSIRDEIDSRFKNALSNDERFGKKTQIDKYGRKIKKKDVKKELSRYYNFEEPETDKSTEDKSDSDDSGNDSDHENQQPVSSASSVSSSDSDSDSESDVPAAQKKAKPSMRELMRGERIDEMSSSDSEISDEDDDSSSDSDSYEEGKIAADEYEEIRTAPSAIPQGDETRRIAVVNLDWDNITSTDLMATFSSFVPPNKRIISVKIYPSEYGKKQLEQEEIHGPPQELFDEESDKRKTNSKSKSKDQPAYDDDQDYSSSNLRRYQLQRLQYYYAVVECDEVSTAANIYSSCDGTEYESTANFFDLRFIPDEVDFSNDKPRDQCFKVSASYQPKSFTTDALQHSKVKLTWDETPKERARVAQKAFAGKDVENEDLKAYLASDSESEEDEETIAERYRALLGGEAPSSLSKMQGAGKDGDDDAVEITFNPVLEGKQAKLEIIDDDHAHKGRDGTDGSTNPEDNLTTLEKYRLKEKQRRLRRQENYKARKAAEQEEQNKSNDTNQAELELVALDDDLLMPGTTSSATAQTSTGKADKNARKMTKRASKKKAQEEAERDFDTADPRFQALFEDPDFAIDSTLPQFKKTKGMERIMGERRKRQDNKDHSSESGSKKIKRDHAGDVESAEQLAAKLRRKTQSH